MSKWISVEDEMPKDGMDCLLAIGDVVIIGSRQITVYKDKWFDDHSLEVPPPTHWQPLPEPPE